MSEKTEKMATDKLAGSEIKDSKAVKADKKSDKKPAKKNKKDRKHPFSEMISELKKVSWPTKEDLRTYTACVVIFVAVSTVLLFVMDFAVTALIDYISDPSKLPTVLNGWFGIGG